MKYAYALDVGSAGRAGLGLPCDFWSFTFSVLWALPGKPLSLPTSDGHDSGNRDCRALAGIYGNLIAFGMPTRSQLFLFPISDADQAKYLFHPVSSSF